MAATTALATDRRWDSPRAADSATSSDCPQDDSTVAHLAHSSADGSADSTDYATDAPSVGATAALTAAATVGATDMRSAARTDAPTVCLSAAETGPTTVAATVAETAHGTAASTDDM
jgi:hypothetical protein